MYLLVVLQSISPSPPISISFPSVDVGLILLRLVAIAPLIGGYLLAREAKQNLALELGAVVLLVLATIIPPNLSGATLSGLLTDLVSRWPIAVILIGLAFVRDGGMKMIIGLLIVVLTGLLVLPR
jgi:hypothetical protein